MGARDPISTAPVCSAITLQTNSFPHPLNAPLEELFLIHQCQSLVFGVSCIQDVFQCLDINSIQGIITMI